MTMNCECALKEMIYRLIVAERRRFELDSSLFALGVEQNNEIFDLYHQILKDIVCADSWGEYLGAYIQDEISDEEIAESICDDIKKGYKK
jgi:hypothetical protein